MVAMRGLPIILILTIMGGQPLQNTVTVHMRASAVIGVTPGILGMPVIAPGNANPEQSRTDSQNSRRTLRNHGHGTRVKMPSRGLGNHVQSLDRSVVFVALQFRAGMRRAGILQL